jgi:hypothetical protein
MSKELQEPTENYTFSQALASIGEAAATLVPLVAIIAGIGMMSTLPATNTTPIFKTPTEAREFFKNINIAWDPDRPIVLSGPDCAKCSILRTELTEAGVPFIERDVNKEASADLLFQAALRQNRHLELPAVVVDGNLVTPRVRAIRVAVNRAGRYRE